MKSYFISSNAYYKDLSTFEKYLQNVYTKYPVDFACYRDKDTFDKKFAEAFLKISKNFGIKNVLLNSFLEEAIKLGYDGVHLPSKKYSLIKKAKRAGLICFYSTHNFFEIDLAKRFGASFITFSPIFPSPNKGIPKGKLALKKAVKKADFIKVFALGGITDKKHIQKCLDAGAYGFASIRYFSP